MKRYESPLCTFAVPDDWVAEPPFAFREPGKKGDRMGAQILERTLATMPSAAAYARELKPILATLYEGFELFQEGPQRMEGPGEGYSIFIRYVDADGNPACGKMTFFTCGPRVCQLFISGPDGDDRERDRLFEAIGKTFAFRGAESLVGAQAGGLTSEVLRLPPADAAKGWPGPWRKFPRCCVELPLPAGWEVASDERDDVLFRRGPAEVRLHRELGESHAVDAWFAGRMRRLLEEGDKLLGSERGESERGPFAAVLSEERGAVRTWKTAAVMRRLDLFLGDRQPLVWSLRAPESDFFGLRSFVESLAAAASFLDPSAWETRMAEPWLDHVLTGPWEPQGRGLYVHAEEPVFIHLSLGPNTLSLARIQPSVIDSLRKIVDPQEGAERVVSGAWRQHDAFHYAVDGSEKESGRQVSLRTVWLLRDRLLYSVFVRGADARTADGISRDLLDSFHPALTASSWRG